MRTWTASLCGVVFTAGCSSPGAVPGPSPSAAAAPTPDPRALRGVVHDFYTKRPLASVPVHLTALSYGCKMPEQKTTTDAEGRFRFEGLPPCAPDDNLLVMVEACKGCMFQAPHTAEGKVLSMVPRSSTDLGALFIGNDTWATEAFAAVCKGASPAPDAGAQSLAAIRWSDDPAGWEADFYLNRELLLEPFLPWAAVLCVRSTTKVVGSYGMLGASGSAMTTRAALVRFRDGKRFTTTVTAQPPRKADSSRGAEGDTTPLVRDWMKKIAAANP